MLYLVNESQVYLTWDVSFVLLYCHVDPITDQKHYDLVKISL